MGLRERPEFETMLGPFVNLLVLRLDLDGDPTFADVLARARNAVLDAFDHRQVPFETMVERLNPVRFLGPLAAISGRSRYAQCLGRAGSACSRRRCHS